MYGNVIYRVSSSERSLAAFDDRNEATKSMSMLKLRYDSIVQREKFSTDNCAALRVES